MRTTCHRVTTLAGLALAALLSHPAPARSVVVPGAPVVVAAQSAAYRLQTGRVSSVDARRGVLVVDGQSYRVEPRKTAFSDDRAEAAGTGLASLRAGDKVVVRSVKSSSLPLAVQIVVQD